MGECTLEALQNVPELVAAARTTAKTAQERVADVLKLIGEERASEEHAEELRAATLIIEATAIDIFSHFELQMQHHFRRGPFSRKLKALLLASDQPDLANRLHQYYLAINVLKHGKGASYSELRNTKDNPFAMKKSQRKSVDDAHPEPGLIDVTTPGFFDGLAATILEAHSFLENKE